MANRDAKLIERTLKDFSLGAMSGSGGSVIVDALPAQGKEGTTYLLRAPKDDLFEGHLYADLINGNTVIVSENNANDLFYNEVDAKLNLSLDESHVVSIGDLSAGNWETPENWQNWLNNSHYIMVSTEQDVLNLTEEYDHIFQDLGVVHLQDYKLTESRVTGDDTVLAVLAVVALPKDCLIGKVLVTDTNIKFETRRLSTDFGAAHPYSFEDWGIRMAFNKVGEITDTFIYDEKVLQPLQEDDTYLINLTPTQPSEYTYQEYVFDKGVFTSINSKTYLLQVRHGSTYEGNRIFFSCQVNSPDIKTYADLCNYLLENHYECYFSSGELDGAILPIVGVLGNFSEVPLGIYATGSNIGILTGESTASLQNDEDITISYCN